MRIKSLLLYIIVFLGITFAQQSFAAEVYFSSPTQDFRTGDKIYFDVYIDSENESVNAIESDIIFPQDILEYVDYYDTNSIITGWVETPKLNGNSIHFAGIVAGGFDGLIDPVTNSISSAKITRLVFIAKSEGKGSLSFTDAKVFKNDGKGTIIETKTLPHEFSVSPEGILVQDFSYDVTPPEPFSVLVKRDDRFFQGHYFLAFDAKDKETGIAYYKVKEGFKKWVTAKSPYLLKDQSLTSNIRVIAVDKNGNEREARVVFDKNPLSTLGMYVFIGLVLVLLAVSIYAYVYIIRRKK